MPEDMSDRKPEDMSDRMPEDMPDRMPEDMPDKMPEDMSDRMPEDLPVTKLINVMVGIARSKVICLFLYGKWTNSAFECLNTHVEMERSGYAWLHFCQL
jgi:hypothetical protein